MRAAILARVSTEEQAENHSIPGQLRTLRSYCESRGWQIVREVAAPGESASTNELTRRPALRAIVELAEAKAVDVVVYHESSRLARDEEMAHWLINRLERFGVRLVNAAKDVDYYTPEGRFLFGLDASLDAYLGRKHGFQVRKGKAEAFEQGLPVGSLPFGYTWQGTDSNGGPLSSHRRQELVVRGCSDIRPVVVPAEARAVRELFTMRRNGRDVAQMVAYLNGSGLRPRSRQGYDRFTHSAVRSLFENDFYAGFVRHKGERRRGVHEPIVDEAVWADSQAQPQERRASARAGSLLSGIARCSVCGQKVWLSSSGPRSGGRSMYRESSHLRADPCENARTLWTADAADEEVALVMRGLGVDEGWLKAAAREARRPVRGPGTKALRQELEARRRRITTAFTAGALSELEWRAQLAEVEAGLSALGPPNVETVLRSAEQLRTWSELWDRMLHSERREAVRIVLSAVHMDTRGKRLWLEPRGEYASLFRHRREALGVAAPPAGTGPHSYTWFAPDELVRKAG